MIRLIKSRSRELKFLKLFVLIGCIGVGIEIGLFIALFMMV